jgi:hypothetical protein
MRTTSTLNIRRSFSAVSRVAGLLRALVISDGWTNGIKVQEQISVTA